MSNMVPLRGLSGHISDLTSKKMSPGGKKDAEEWRHLRKRDFGNNLSTINRESPMRVGHIVLLVLLLTFSGFHGVAGASSFFRVRWVDDGDTIILADGTRVRYIGINAPEVAHGDTRAQRFGPEARDLNRRLVHKRIIRLEFDKERRDQYSRVLGYVFLKDGTLVNAELIRSGCAHYVFRRPNTKYDSLLLRLQREAMAKRVGMWDKFPDQKGPFLGNRRSRRFHHITCPFGKTTSSRHRMTFKSTYDAFWGGYSPCKRCLNGGL